MNTFTQNFFKDLNGPIPWVGMGPLTERPSTADLNSLYISTDSITGKWTIYWYNEGWNMFTGIEK